MGKPVDEIELLLEIFPYSIVLNQGLGVDRIGTSFSKICPLIEGSPFLDHFKIQRPYIEDFSFEILCSLINDAFYVKHTKSDLMLRGQFRCVENQSKIIFLASLWVMDVEQLKPFKLNVADFPSHDPTFDYLHVMKQAEINKNELTDLLKKIDRQSAVIKKSNAELNFAKIQLESIFNEMSDVMYSISMPNQEVLFVTPSVESMFEVGMKEFSDNFGLWKELVIEDDRIVYTHIENQLLARGEFNVNYRIKTSSGNIKWINNKGKFIFDTDKKPIRLDGMATDRTQQYQAEEELDQELKLQEALIDIASTYINLDPKDVENTINRSLEKMGLFVAADRSYIFDYDFDKATTSNTYEWCHEGIDPEISNLQKVPIAFFPQWVEQHQKGEAFYIPDVSELNDDGEGGLKSILEPQGIKSLITIPMLDSQKLLGFVGFDSVKNHHDYSDKEKRLLFLFGQMLINIRNRQKWDNQLRLQEEKYRNIIANMNLGLMEVDPEENIIHVNQSFCDISGYTADEIIGQKATQFLLTEDDLMTIDSKKSLRENGLSDNYEVAVRNKKGEVRWWFISGGPNYNDKNELIGSIGIHLDITNQKLLEKDLEQALILAEDASKAKESFLANMSHEIRTPLNAIIGMIRELGREELTPKQNSYVNHSETAARHLLTIVNNILDMSKIEAGELVLESKEFSLSSVIGNIKSILYNKAEEKNIQFDCKISSLIKPALIGDNGRVRQILINLIGNSIKFTEKGSVELDVTVKHTNQYFQQIVFDIKDTGIGMSEEFLSKIFNKFSQEEGASNRRFEGTGLGMTITKEMIHLMGGNLHIKSEKNRGTTVSIEITFPIGDEGKLVDKNIHLVDNSLNGLRVLLVEDNEMNRFIATQSLHFFGCKVTSAINGLEAIDAIEKSSFDLILMDIQMPEMDGVEATKHIRNVQNNHIPIIALTANAFKKDIDLYLSIGMNDYVTKPFDESVLFNTIANTLNILTNIPHHVDDTTTTKVKQTKRYDLTKIIELSRGDQSFVDKMIEIFIDHTPSSILEMKNALHLNEFLVVSKTAHRMKPSIDNMGIYSLTNVIREIESKSKEEHPDSKSITALVSTLDETLMEVIKALKEEKKM